MIKLHLSGVMLAGLAVGLLLAGTVDAYPRQGEGRERIADRLELTDEQRQAMREARAAHREAMAEARASGDRERMREQAKSMREAYAEILTDEQRATLREARSEMREAHVDRMVERLSGELGLHVSQEVLVREALVDVMSEARPQMRIRGGGAGKDRKAMRSEWQESRAALRERLSEILTPQQLEQYDELRHERRRQYRHRERG